MAAQIHQTIYSTSQSTQGILNYCWFIFHLCLFTFHLLLTHNHVGRETFFDHTSRMFNP